MADTAAKTGRLTRDGWILIGLVGVFVFGVTAYSVNLTPSVDSGHWVPKAEVFRLFRILNSVCHQYHVKYGEYPGATSGDGKADLMEKGSEWSDQLRPLLQEIDGKTYHLVFEGMKNRYSCLAVPLLTDTLSESFYIDESTPVRVERDYARNGPASSRSATPESLSAP